MNNPWVVVAIVLAASVAIFFLLGLITYSLMKKKEPKLNIELAKLEEYETDRGKELLKVIGFLDMRGYGFDKATVDLLKNGVAKMPELTMEARSKFKNIADFCSVFLVKIHNEDKRFGRFIPDEDAAILKTYRTDSEIKYKSYNHIAAMYNAFSTMLFTKGIMMVKREKGVQALMF